mmetsp:Transcript_102192/g.248371  ORF Transcript_102192/g.248371 Transcript_102192/m.248371 type:complete len:108 (+) Transcript_102192:183-506(+)
MHTGRQDMRSSTANTTACTAVCKYMQATWAQRAHPLAGHHGMNAIHGLRKQATERMQRLSKRGRIKYSLAVEATTSHTQLQITRKTKMLTLSGDKVAFTQSTASRNW